MGIFRTSKEKSLETKNKVQQFTIDCQDFRLSAQRYLLESQEAYIKEADEEIEALKKELELQKELSHNYEKTIILLTGENGRYDLN